MMSLNKSYLLLFSLLLCACSPKSETSPAAAPSVTAVPAALPGATSGAETVEATDVPAAPSVPISVRFDDAARAIPQHLSPLEQEAEVTAQYLEITSSGSNAWPGATVFDNHFFMLEISSRAQEEAIHLTFPIVLEIRRVSAPSDGVNILSPAGGGGGGVSRYFSNLPLASGVFELMPDDNSPAVLGHGQQSIFYMFDTSCPASGVYHLLFHIPYTREDSSGSHNMSLRYPVQLVCPQRAALWYLNGDSLQPGGEWQLQDGRYVKTSQN